MSDPNKTPTGRALVVGLTHVNQAAYGGWDGQNGCQGCANDAATISEALINEGFEVLCLLDEKATASNILASISEAGRDTKAGDTFFFFFAGHGGQKRDTDNEESEPDLKDETLVCFEREIIDDELRRLWETFVEASVIYMVGDSCNSGTQARLFKDGPSAARVMLPLEYQSPYSLGSRNDEWPELKATMLHMGGCRDGFSSMGDADGGVFTKALVRAWRMGHGEQTWKDLFNSAVETITTQDPSLNIYGRNSEKLRLARPFTPYREAEGTSKFEIRNSNFEFASRDEGMRLIDAGYANLTGDDDPADRAALLRSGVLLPDPLDVEGQSRSDAPRGLPIGESAARRATRWLMENFGPELIAAGKDTPFGPEVLCGIVCQETAFFWLPIVDKLKNKPEYQDNPEDLVDLVVARCVLDASGDYPGTSRSAFPRNADAFRQHYGTAFTAMLVGEANETRALKGYSARNYLYKGYGIFQYDLQFVKEDESFFRNREWYDFSNCLKRCMGELKSIQARTHDKWETIYSYNGKGAAARRYCDNVKVFSGWAADEIRQMPDQMTSTRSAAGGRNARGIMPSTSPRIPKEKLEDFLDLLGYRLDRQTYPLLVVGIRGYYLDDMGEPGKNERGIYDDAIFVLSEDGFASYNGNTDPSSYKKGSGTGSQKGRARLNSGVWLSYKFDTHYGSSPHPAICQRVAPVTVTRDGIDGDYQHTGLHGINIHRGGYNGTSSLGCQTIHPTQWDSFYYFAKDLAQRYFRDDWEKVTIPYILMNETDIRKLQGGGRMT